MPREILARYYAERAREYDRIYEKPERQADLAQLRRLVGEWSEGQRIVEIACGTGYWTEVLARRSSFVLGSDVATEVLEIARDRRFRAPVEFQVADAFDPLSIPGSYTMLFAGFWLSHLPRREVRSFLANWEGRLGMGAAVVLLDNRYVEGSSTPVSRADLEGNTYQRRQLDSGEQFEVLKNFYEQEELAVLLGANASEITIRELPHYWAARYVVKNGRGGS